MTLLDLTPRVRTSPRLDTLPVAVIGAGPVGLAAAAHLARRGVAFDVFERGATPAAAVREWGHTRLFSPWEHLVDDAARELLTETGWREPPAHVVPTGAALVSDYLEPLAAHPAIAGRIRYGTEVAAVTREGMDRTRTAGRADAPLALRVTRPDGTSADVASRAVVDASGTWANPSALGSSGLAPLGLDAVADRVLPALPDVLGRDRDRFAGRHTTVVGAGHSAAGTLIALATLARLEPGTRATWLIRSSSAKRVTTADDELEGRGALGSRLEGLVATGRVAVVDSFEIAALDPTGDGVRMTSTRGAAHETDLIVSATGFRPDLSMLRELRVELDDVVEAPKRLAPLIDPNEHSCGTVEPHGYRELSHPEPGFYIVGMKSYGRAPTFLLRTGYEQVRSVVAWIAGDAAAAGRVELALPATGVCDVGGGCC
ncbi:NAD(P)-binding domain-containing protein [Microbacterium halophytorum]|uniref:NAD(P)-binding domain-containing protein n=1 Tax=Microbacterium halophytorum TaxID=2067568 RepID=UPI000CFCB0E2|nr:NAD(P)-binding domain-containing protein [Microbacterium halophytorum]